MNRRAFVLTLIWILISALTNTSSKHLLNGTDPMVLTYSQFLSNVLLSLLFKKIPWPTRDVVRMGATLSTTLLLSHVFASFSMSLLSIPLFHTVKALAPLFTVGLAYMMGSPSTIGVYVSLLVITVGVGLVCSANFQEINFYGVLLSMLSTWTTVIQTVYSKTIFDKSKFDSSTVVFYSSAGALLLFSPMFLWSELGSTQVTTFSAWMIILFAVNGISHYLQALIALEILVLISPVSFAVSSLFKRIAIVTASFLVFRDPLTAMQLAGIAVTFLGLLLYDRHRYFQHQSQEIPLHK
jgi:solute carrier family 35 protein E1